MTSRSSWIETSIGPHIIFEIILVDFVKRASHVCAACLSQAFSSTTFFLSASYDIFAAFEAHHNVAIRNFMYENL